jgi:acyl-CoA reductase-like NAD-dependent aldehyde dehydrogenase
MTAYDKLFINGKWVASSGTDTLEVTDSATEEVIASIPERHRGRRRRGRRGREGRLPGLERAAQARSAPATS